METDIDGRTQKVRPVGSWVLDNGNVVTQWLVVSLDKPLEWATVSCSATLDLAWKLGL